jgi:signal transduction histidine kinase
MLSLDYPVHVPSMTLRILVIGSLPGDRDESCPIHLGTLFFPVHLEQVDSMSTIQQDQIQSGFDCVIWCEASGVDSTQKAEEFRKAVGAWLVLLLEADGRDEFPEPNVIVAPDVWVVPPFQLRSVLPWAFGQCCARKREALERLALETQLREAAYRIEMAEGVSTVLHNVGNVLSSVTVAGKTIEELTEKSSVALVGRMADLLKEHEQDWVTFLTEDTKGRKILPLLQKLGGHLIAEQHALLKEAQGLTRHIHHMRQIIRSHQGLVRSHEMVELVLLEDLLDEAIELSFQSGDVRGLQVVRSFQGVPPMLMDKHQVLQILVNLLRNAKQAMQQRPRGTHILTVATRLVLEDSCSRVEVEIGDTGIGIAAEQLSQMFTRGFTTKREGNGIGLHSSLLTLKKMGGALSVRSDGIGTGATFTLRLPIPREANPYDGGQV